MKHIPNILSTFRIVMIPFYLIAIFNEDKLGAGLILIVSGITDLLDGFLARQFNWMSEIGKLLDPLADKLTQTAISLSFIFLIQEYVMYFWIILTKDTLLMIGSYYAYRKDLQISSARWFGKIATFCFYITMILIILFPNISTITINVLLSIVVVLSVYAMVKYFILFFSNLNKVDMRTS